MHDVDLQPTLNNFASQPLTSRRLIRSHIQSLFTTGSPSSIEDDKDLISRVSFKEHAVKMILPVSIGDYTDFCESFITDMRDKNLLNLSTDISSPTHRRINLPHSQRRSSALRRWSPHPSLVVSSSDGIPRSSILHHPFQHARHPTEGSARTYPRFR